jgi:transcriptional regulator with XRE-family HTH domain
MSVDAPPEIAFGRFLKFWRGVHSLSQEDLAEKLDSSPRHISRLENGSGRASETLVLEIAKALNLGKRDLNHLLISAGYAAQEDKVDFHSPEMKWLRKSMLYTLKALDPYPTAIMDGSANILMVNRAWVGFFRNSIPQALLDKVNNHYDFLFSREGAGKDVSQWEDTLSLILMSLQQKVLFSNAPAEQAELERLLNLPVVPKDWQQRASKIEPMASFRVQTEINGVLQKFFSVSSTVGAIGPAAYVSEPQLTINTLYPEDESMALASLIHDDLIHPLLFY